jgi:drug/metabolite transporter (DMT)-like permease
MNRTAILYALVSAALFGVSTPAAKLLIGSMQPAMLAGLLYCGAGIGIAGLRALRAAVLSERTEAAVSRADLPWLAGAIAAGGIVGPLLLMAGLTTTEASTASLLLTVEGAATALLAWLGFHESFNRRIALGMLCVVAGAIVLSWSGKPVIGSVVGPLAIVGACVAWAFDNNLTRKVSLSDPLQIVQLKGLIAGPVNLGIGLAAGAALPDWPDAAVVGVIGFFGYGVSLALFVRALRDLGSARTGAYFSTAPFIGSAVAVVVLGEPLTVQLIAAGALMAVGAWLHLTEHHEHEHVHEAMAHTHAHVHDQHHRHRHDPSDPPGEPHAHFHRHAPMRHAHAHAPDMHHTHRHRAWSWRALFRPAAPPD